MTELRIENADLRYGDLRLFRAPLSFTATAGEILSITGASGSGKSSLLAWISGTAPETLIASGQIYVDGQNVTNLPCQLRRIGILFQEDCLFDHMSVEENLGFGLPRGLGRAARAERIASALAKAELSGFEKRDPATLSGGQRARISLMRCLLAEPKSVLLDEPFSKLDSHLRARFRSWVCAHIRQAALPAVLVSHEYEDVQAVSGPIISLDETHGCAPHRKVLNC